jgi:hypothetical protein
MWVLTVLRLINNLSAIASFVLPVAIMARISISLDVSSAFSFLAELSSMSFPITYCINTSFETHNSPLNTAAIPLGISVYEIRKNKVASRIGETPCYFASLDDLIRMKKASGSQKDKEDLNILMKIKKRISGKFSLPPLRGRRRE